MASDRETIVEAPPSSDRMLLLVCNSFWKQPLSQSLPDCPDDCELTTDQRRFLEADAVVFHIPSLGSVRLLPKPAQQKWVAWSMESDVNYPQLADPAFMARFDLTMTYRLDSDVPALYLDLETLHEFRRPPQEKTAEAEAVYFASNRWDRNGRNEYVRVLMQHLTVHSYGKCLRNRTLAEDRGLETKLQVSARYKFTLAFENSSTWDYVTEKFFDPLRVGSVPVYLGAPNADEFAPGDHCFIRAEDFAGPGELAAYLKRVAADRELYGRYFTWKREPFRKRFSEMVDLKRTSLCRRLCAALAEKSRMAPCSRGCGLHNR
jgi:hypothetical protein